MEWSRRTRRRCGWRSSLCSRSRCNARGTARRMEREPFAAAALDTGATLEGVDVAAGLERWTPRATSDAATATFQRAARIGAVLLTPADAEWPAGLADLGSQGPMALWVRGNVQHLRTLGESYWPDRRQGRDGLRRACRHGGGRRIGRSRLHRDLRSRIRDRRHGPQGRSCQPRRNGRVPRGRRRPVLPVRPRCSADPDHRAGRSPLGDPVRGCSDQMAIC